jgi:hypothetical protein
MDQETVDSADELDESPEAIREAMTGTRRDLARHLGKLRDLLITPQPLLAATKDTSMPAQKKQLKSVPSKGKKHPDQTEEKRPDTRTSRAKTAKDNGSSKKLADDGKAKSSKRSASGKSTSTNGAKARNGSGSTKSKSSSSRSRKSVEKSLVEKAGEVVDTLVAGAVVGAVTGAAQHVAHEPGALPLVAAPSPPAATGDDREKPTTREVLGELASGAALGAMSGAAKSVLPAETPKASKGKRSKGRS